MCWHLPIFPGRHQPSIFGTNELNFRVRDGNGWTLIVINTNSCRAPARLDYNTISNLKMQAFFEVFLINNRRAISDSTGNHQHDKQNR